MRLIRAVLVALPLVLLPASLLADPPGPVYNTDLGTGLGTPLSASEFDTYATGKTLHYAQGGVVWGSEQYLPGHQVMWAFTDQPCEFGQWYADSSAICFIYEGKTEASCWNFYRGATGLIARFVGGRGSLSEVAQTPEPLNCPGPQVGA
jgi:hypothetical protein